MIPEDDALTELSLVATDVAIIVTFASMALIIGLLVYAITSAARYHPQGMLVVVLAVIAVLGMFLFALARVTDVLTISATAVGALAGALTSLFRTPDRPGQPQSPAPGDDDPEAQAEPQEGADAAQDGPGEHMEDR